MVIKLDNLFEVNNIKYISTENKKFYVGDYIPDWNKYKFHLVTLVLSNNREYVSWMQQQVFGTQRCYYNNNQPYPTTANSNDNGSISFGINIDGKVSFGGSSKLSLTSWVHEIFMWGKIN